MHFMIYDTFSGFHMTKHVLHAALHLPLLNLLLPHCSLLSPVLSNHLQPWLQPVIVMHHTMCQPFWAT